MNILNQKFRILSLTFLLASLPSSNCSNITDERSACEYRVSQLLQTCTVASLLWPNYYFGQESSLNNQNVRNSLTFCTIDYLQKTQCRGQKDYLPTRKDLDK